MGNQGRVFCLIQDQVEDYDQAADKIQGLGATLQMSGF